MKDIDFSLVSTPLIQIKQVSDQEIHSSMQDPSKRVPEPFQIPKGMKISVEFWLKIYTQYTSHHVVIFDEKHPELIYEVLDFTNLFLTSRNAIVYEILRKRKLEATLSNYKKAFSDLSRKKNHLSREAKIITQVIKKSKHRHHLSEFSKNFRTQTGQRDRVMSGLAIADHYFPEMEAIFVDAGIPTGLTRLPLVESSFNHFAVSKAGAVGVWQFMKRTGDEFSLIMTDHIDERLSPIKSATAAAQLLKHNYQVLGSWPLAISAYNMGFKQLLKPTKTVIKNTTPDKLFEPCSKKFNYGWAGRNYYAEFLAIVTAESYRDVFYPQLEKRNIHKLSFIQLEKKMSALQFAKSRGILITDFKLMNPDIRDLKAKLPRGIWIAVSASETEISGLLTSKSALLAKRMSKDFPFLKTSKRVL